MGVSETIYSEGSEVLEGWEDRDSGDDVTVVPSQNASPPASPPASSPASSPVSDDTIRNASLAFTLVPPLLFTTWGDPSSFISALSLAGGYGMTLLYGILPPMMAFVNRREEGSGRLLVGGEGVLLLLWAAGCGFFGLRLFEDLSY